MNARLQRRNYGNGHGYRLDGEDVVGVTTAISKGVPKQLTNWAAKLVAVAAVEQRDQWEQLGTYEAVEWLRQRPYAKRDTAAVKGTKVHALAKLLLDGKEVDVPDELTGYVDACIAFLTDFAVDEVVAEVPVAHTGADGVPVLYAGTLDLLCVIGSTAWLIDWKTGADVYGESALQLAAYRYCDLALVGGVDQPMPAVDRCGVVHLRSDGYELRPVEAGQLQWRAFLHAVHVARFCETSRELVGEALQPE